MKRIALLAAVVLASCSSAFGQSPGDGLSGKTAEWSALMTDLSNAGPPVIGGADYRVLAYFFTNFAASQISVAQRTPGWQPVVTIDFKFSPTFLRRTTSDPIYNTLSIARAYLNLSRGNAAIFSPYRNEQVLPY